MSEDARSCHSLSRNGIAWVCAYESRPVSEARPISEVLGLRVMDAGSKRVRPGFRSATEICFAPFPFQSSLRDGSRLRQPPQIRKRVIDLSWALAYAFAYEDKNGGEMTVITATDARNKLYKIVDSVAESHEPILISGKRTSAVLISEDDWRSIQETLYLCAIPGMRESIIAGLRTPVSKCKKDLEW